MYTSIGGLKAVVWTDAFQALLMYGGLIAEGTVDIGSMKEVFDINKRTGRLNAFLNADFNPFQYMTLWASLFGGGLIWVGHYGGNQLAQQRYRSMPTIKSAQHIRYFVKHTSVSIDISSDLLRRFSSVCLLQPMRPFKIG